MSNVRSCGDLEHSRIVIYIKPWASGAPVFLKNFPGGGRIAEIPERVEYLFA